ncbi:MAG: 5-oxoprolinase/urea amidolyase family protein [Microbacterium sp.]|uniref:5-oxoprolinase subunit B/C family protein n=1 Tax=Microbacterium sp. TaxID=51671 RepID=UPI003A8B90C5
MVSPARILPMGERALLVEVAALDEVLALHGRLEASRPPGVVELVPAARTVLVCLDPDVLALSAARSWIERSGAARGRRVDASGPRVELPIAYDGPDLADTAALLGVDVDELVRRHRDAEWTVAFTGFAPGFGYLVSDGWRFDVPRLGTPRTRVPPGAVGLAAGFTGAYPRETPGGWRLIGTTPAPLWRPGAEPPALLAPGTRVQFVEESSPARGSSRHPLHGSVARAPRTGAERSDAVRVTQPGLLATVQDLGRPGRAAEGVARSGALDRGALRTANRLVGNDERAAGIEVTMGGLRAVAERDLWVAVAGGWGPIRIDGEAIDPYGAARWPAGTELHVDWLARGARSYLAVRGGIDTEVVAGARAADLMAGLGHAPLAAGDVLPVGVADAPIPPADLAPWGPPDDAELELELAPGPRADWFPADAQRLLFEARWVVTNDADRVGMRLDGPALDRTRDGELPSEGMVPGALQVPPGGRPTILLADGPVTGGYPVIAVVADASLDALAQARPGTGIRFRHARPVL